MSILSEFRPTERAFARWVRDVRRILTSGEEGVRLGENLGRLVTFEYRGVDGPFRVKAPTSEEPSGVYLVRAVVKDGDDAFRQSGNRVGFYWRGGDVEVTVIDDLNTTTLYTVTLLLLYGEA